MVQILVVTEAESISDEARVAWMQREAERWLAQQPTNAVREPPPLSPGAKQELDAEFDQLLADIRRGAEGRSEEEIMADVKETLEATRGANG